MGKRSSKPIFDDEADRINEADEATASPSKIREILDQCSLDHLKSDTPKLQFGNNDISVPTEQKLLMLKVIPDFMKTHFNDVPNFDGFDDGKFDILISNLDDMIQKFREFTEAGKVFVANFYSWKKKRTKSIDGLKQVVESLNTHRLNSNISRLTGSSVGIIGGFITIAGIVLLPFSFGASTPLIIGGAVTAGAGGATNFGTAITETVLTRNLIRGADNLIKEDEMEFRCFSHWFKHSAAFMESVTKIVDYNVFVNILEDVSKLLESFNRQGSKEVIPIEKLLNFTVVCCKKENLVPNDTVNMTFMVVIMFLNPEQLKLMLHLHRNNPVVFEAIVTSSKVLFQVARMTDAGVDVGSAVASVIRGGAVTSKPIVAVVANSVFAGLGVALDVLTIVLTSIDVHNGSESKHSTTIKTVVESFEEELSVLTQLYEELKKPILQVN